MIKWPKNRVLHRREDYSSRGTKTYIRFFCFHTTEIAISTQESNEIVQKHINVFLRQLCLNVKSPNVFTYLRRVDPSLYIHCICRRATPLLFDEPCEYVTLTSQRRTDRNHATRPGEQVRNGDTGAQEATACAEIKSCVQWNTPLTIAKVPRRASNS